MIRPATTQDMPALRQVYAAARAFMKASANPNQWGDNHPAEALLWEDIALGRLYVNEADGRVCGAFALIPGEDPTYGRIDGGHWRSDSPYGTIHRLASDGAVPGLFSRCLAFCRARHDHLRIDTHIDNRVMQHLAEKNGFVYCGIIYLLNGDPRLAYEWLKQK